MERITRTAVCQRTMNDRALAKYWQSAPVNSWRFINLIDIVCVVQGTNSVAGFMDSQCIVLVHPQRPDEQHMYLCSLVCLRNEEQHLTNNNYSFQQYLSTAIRVAKYCCSKRKKSLLFSIQ